MLIAGELYIHFKDQSVEEVKFEEVMKTLATHIEKLDQAVSQREETATKLGPGIINSQFVFDTNRNLHHFLQMEICIIFF